MGSGLLLLVANILGFITVFKSLVAFATWVWVTFLRPPKNLKEYGSWALVTGSTDGIGKELVFELASKGLNLVLVGRNPTKLSATTNQVQERYGHEIQVRSIVIDFLLDSSGDIGRKIEEGIDGLDIGILINNAGVSNSWPRFLHEEADSEVSEAIKVNVGSVTSVTRAVLPVMLGKQRGAIVNIGSGTAGVVPSFPLYTVYSATKGYINQFSRSLHAEYKHYGIDVQCQIPLLVATKMLPIRGTTFFVPTAEEYSKACLRWIGYEPICMPYWRHALQGFFFRAIPEASSDSYFMRFFHKLREKERRRLNKKK